MHTAISAAGFIDDSKADLELRNFYIDRDNRSGVANPSRQSEWGQGFILNYRSGYTEGPVGFGIDAIGLLGLRLDSGKGTHYNPTSSNRGGQVFPTDKDGRAVDEFSSLGPTLKARVSKTEVRVGTLLPTLPVVTYNDGRMVPQTYLGGQVTSREIDGLTLTAGKLTQAKGRNSTDNQGLSILGANNATTGRFVNSFVFAGGDYAISKNLVAQYYYGKLEDFYVQHFFGLTDIHALPVGSLKTDLRGFLSDSTGKNASRAGRAEGYVGNGYGNEGEIDNRAWSAAFTYSLAGHSIGLGYQRLTGSSDAPFLTMGDGVRAYLATDRSLNTFQHAGERTVFANYGYDFAAVGIPGLKFAAEYLKGDHIATSSGSSHEWYRGTSLEYAFQQQPLKGLSLIWRNGSFRTAFPGARDTDETKLIVSYKLALL
ncbi:OprD family porin [Pseudomonas sp. 21LCFQ02]|uniref:OprD family porin n=1 Tax=Pseudomonas sp. 21LCFQ02 TaxID=2957505 RepID=UPI00209B520C|nr:OprD family porin [Pseudomonas sp. 21LCFQ02]MCO8167506.1 OprD family porin [Pseudomonas sp. 21LCFQ02]